MTGNGDVTEAMASVGTDYRRRVEEAVAAIIALAWVFRRDGFSFHDDADLDRRVNALLRELSLGNLDAAEGAAEALLAEAGLAGWSDDAVDYAVGETDGRDSLWRLDMHSTHLKEVIAGWIAAAAVAGLTEAQTRERLWIYLRDPSLSPEWRRAGLKRPEWGSGYPADVLTGMTTVGQDIVNRAYQYASIQRFKALGARFYRTRRNSSFHCPLCDEMSERLWPVDVVVLPYHPRCVCSAEPVYDDEA